MISRAYFIRSISILMIVATVMGLTMLLKSPQNRPTPVILDEMASVIQEDLVQSEITPLVTPSHVIFDLNGVLFEMSKKRAASVLGVFDAFSYTLSGKKIEDLSYIIFDIIYRLDGDTQQGLLTAAGDKLIPMHREKPYPRSMCLWLEGKIESQILIEKLLTLIDQLDEENFFSSNLEKRLIKKIASIMFDPHVCLKLYKPIKKGVSLLKQCKKAGHKVYLLSNLDTELMKLLQEKYADIFELFDGIVISGSVGMIKPHNTIYDYALKTYNINPQSSYFIDDQQENILGARKAGITSMQFTGDNYKDVRKELIAHAVLPSRHELHDERFEEEGMHLA